MPIEYGQIPIEQQLLQTGNGLLTIKLEKFALAPWRTPNQVVKNGNPKLIAQQHLIGMALPVVLHINANRKFSAAGGVTFFDLYINRQLVKTQQVDLVTQAYLFGGVDLTQVGVVSVEFQASVPLPNPALIEIGFHGFLSEPTEELETLAVAQVVTNTELEKSSVYRPGQGSFFYSEDTII